MNKLLVLSLSILSLTFLGGKNTETSGHVGKVWPSEKTVVKNDMGYEVIQWTTAGRNRNLYFNIDSFIDDTTALIISDRTGQRNLFKLNLHTGEMTQMTSESQLRGDAHWPKLRTLWYLNGDTLKSLNTKTLESKAIYTFTEFKPQSFSVTCDGKYFVYSVNKHPGFSKNSSSGPYAILRLDMASKQIKQISPDYGFIMSHLLCNPVDPKILSYCWQHVHVADKSGIVGMPPIRIWWLNIDGTKGGPVGKQDLGIHRTHEFWLPNGKMLGYAARYIWDITISDSAGAPRQSLGATNLQGSDEFNISLKVEWAHPQVSRDLKKWVTDYYDGRYIALFTIENRRLVKTEVLFKDDASWSTGGSEPCPQFSPNGKLVIFNTDFTGSPQVYTVSTSRAKK